MPANSMFRRFPRVLLALLFLTSAVLSGGYFLINAHDYQLAGRLISHVPTAEKVLALTFDDGPSERTPEILRILEREQVKATFFLVGQQIEAHPDWARAIVKAGHELGNHSYSHQRMVFKPAEFYAQEIEKTDALIRQSGYTGPILFRPPYGKKLWGLPRYLAQTQRINLMWDLEPEFWISHRSEARLIIQETLQKAQPGSILLLHPMGQYSQSFEALPELLRQLKAAGWKIVPARDLLH